MLRKIVIAGSVLFLAFGILFISILRSAEIKYDFSSPIQNAEEVFLGDNDIYVDYNLPFPGKVLPDNPLWTLKALRDNVWLFTTTNASRKAELLLMFADKRLLAAEYLFEKGNPELGVYTFLRSEEYLQRASKQEYVNSKAGINTNDFLKRVAMASLKHRQIIEQALKVSPEDARPQVIKILDIPKKVYTDSSQRLNEEGLPVPVNPFDREK